MKEAGRGSSSSGLSWLNIGQCPLRCLSIFRSGEQEFSTWPALIASPILPNITPASPAQTPSRAPSPAKSPLASFPSTTNRPPTICLTPTRRGPLPRTSPARFSTSLPIPALLRLHRALLGGSSTASTRSHSSLSSEEHTSELKSLMHTSYAVFCLQKKNTDYSLH